MLKKEKILGNTRFPRIWWRLLDSFVLSHYACTPPAKNPSPDGSYFWGVVDRTAASPENLHQTKTPTLSGRRFCLVETAGLEPVTSCV